MVWQMICYVFCLQFFVMDSPTVGGQVVMLNMGTHSGLSGTPSTLTLIALNIMNHFLLIQAIPLK